MTPEPNAAYFPTFSPRAASDQVVLRRPESKARIVSVMSFHCRVRDENGWVHHAQLTMTHRANRRVRTNYELNKKKTHIAVSLFVSNNPLAVTYFPTPSQVQYRERYDVSLPCSGWERVGPSCSYHQEKDIS